jgi:hypothetical protein
LCKVRDPSDYRSSPAPVLRARPASWITFLRCWRPSWRRWRRSRRSELGKDVAQDLDPRRQRITIGFNRVGEKLEKRERLLIGEIELHAAGLRQTRSVRRCCAPVEMVGSAFQAPGEMDYLLPGIGKLA